MLGAGLGRMLLINDLFFNSAVVSHRVTKLGAPRALTFELYL